MKQEIGKLSKKTTLVLVLIFSLIFSPLAQSQDLIISEFLTINDANLADEDGDYSDWIEIHNAGSASVSLLGWYVTDNASVLTKWKFPEVTLAAGGYIVVFASEKKRSSATGNLHTNFKLSGSGEFLALIKPDGITSTTLFDEYPVQSKDVSYGLIDDQYTFLTTPSPGTANTTAGAILDPAFSHSRGFYDASFTLTVSDLNSDTDIYYTTNGSSPTLTNATKYSSPLIIDKTTVLSLVAIDQTDQTLGNVITQTYIFADILDQPNNPAGYPSRWTSSEAAFFPGDYEMDPEICTAENKPALFAALKALPTVSLVTDVEHLFRDDPDNDWLAGIYLNSVEHSEPWERPVSMEYFDPEENVDFQINCGLRIHGGNGRKPSNSPKHSLRVHFRSEYGPSKLNFNMFDEKSASNEFNTLVFRAGYNYSWLKNSPAQCAETDYVRDPFTKKTQLDMDRLAAHRKFAHIYLNGLYWGVYDISEKITDDFVSEYLGGKEDDYDVVKDHNGVTDGTDEAWKSLITATNEGFETNEKYQKIQGKNEDGSINASYQNLLDVRNLTDYILINFYISNTDWDKNNWLATRNRATNKEGFKFLCWDAETSMNNLHENITDKNEAGNPTGIFNKLLENTEYRVYLADRIQKHFFNGGAMTPEETAARYQEIANELGVGLLAESARWGDYRRDVDGGGTYALYTKEDHWQPRVDYMLNTYFPQRTDIVVAQLKNAGWFLAIDPPQFSEEGGDHNKPFNLDISSDTDTIYYTTDDSDPRLFGGQTSSSAMLYKSSFTLATDMTIQARAKKGSVWSALTKANFNVSSENVTFVDKSICQGEAFKGFETTGGYVITETSSTGADSIVVLNLTVNPLPDFTIGEDTAVYQHNAVLLQPDTDFDSYLWNTGATTKSLSVENNEEGVFSYWLQVTNDHGCINKDTIEISVNKPDILSAGQNTLQSIKVFPNPATDKIQIELANSKLAGAKIRITAISGAVMFTGELNAGADFQEIDITKFSAGIYMLNIKSDKTEKSIRLIKQ
ncbi:MAG: CotH kinase family protein [Cyclobacteriaceae bacterium]